MTDESAFLLQDFWPYLLNRAAETTSLEFQEHYKRKYGMLRTEWRVVFHLGRYGSLTAKDICQRAGIHKTKVSRAVSALERRRFVTRSPLEADRRHEVLTLTKAGEAAFADLVAEAERYSTRLMEPFSAAEAETFQRMLRELARMPESNN